MELFALSLAAGQDANEMFSIGIWEIVKALGALVLVVVLSIWVLWFYGKKMSHYRTDVMRVVDMLPLERNARIYLVEVADTYILVGVSKDKVAHLCTLGKKGEVRLESLRPTSGGEDALGSRGFGGLLESVIERMRLDRDDDKTQEIDDETID